jgi:uncharacterized protein (TIGR02118 family)
MTFLQTASAKPWKTVAHRRLERGAGIVMQMIVSPHAGTLMDRRTSFALMTAGLATAGTHAAPTATSAVPASGGIKFMVLYGHPPKPEEFEKYYLGVHMPLVAAIKGARRMEAAKCMPQADGSPPAFYRVFEMWFDSAEQMAAVFDTPEGKKVRADLPNFTAGTTVTRVVSSLD